MICEEKKHPNKHPHGTLCLATETCETVTLIRKPSDLLRMTFLLLLFYNCIVQMRFLPWEIRVAFSGESQPRQSRATQPTVRTGCFSVSKIHRTLTWTTGSLTCPQMLMQAIAHGGVRTHVRESVLKVDSGRKIPFRTGESNLRHQWHQHRDQSEWTEA